MAAPNDLPSLYPLLLAHAIGQCRIKGLPEDLAEDLVQELYVRTKHLLDTTKPRGQVYAFLRRQIDWMALDVARHRDYVGHLWRGDVSLDDLTERGLL